MRFRSAALVTAALPALTLLALVNWFWLADVYHHHFFDRGVVVAVYNVARVAFAVLFLWMVYSLGYGTLKILKRDRELDWLLPIERAVLGFGTGIGVLHLLMLVLGVANLYYSWLMLVLCLVLLCASGNHFAHVARDFFSRWPIRWSRVTFTMAISVGIAAFWLLAVKGLYPSGDGDYYTHYFYYYLEVLRNHGLQPNDVWYHYYYSKGAGATFLGMLLTDPEAPELVTYCCVFVTAVAMATLAARLLPNSLWPAFAAFVFLILYINGGIFQMTHEESSALIVFVAWALCMRLTVPSESRRAFLIMAAAALIGAATLELAAAIILALVLSAFAICFIVRRERAEAMAYGMLAVIGSGAAAAILVLNYTVTGLATDQLLNITLKFANLERLYGWGVIPQIIIVAWIRDNYALGAAQMGLVPFIREYLRLDALRVLLGSAVLALGIRAMLLWRIPRAVISHSSSGGWTSVADVGLFCAAFLRSIVSQLRSVKLSEYGVVVLMLIAVLSLANSIEDIHQHLRFYLFCAAIVASGTAGVLSELRARRRRQVRGVFIPAQMSDAQKVALFLGALVVAIAIISVPAAGSQTVSYIRFSSFFVPLIIMFVIACWAVLGRHRDSRAVTTLVSFVAPCVLLVVTLGWWQISGLWFTQSVKVTQNAVRFVTGNYSLADAYSHQSNGLPYGGLEPAALEAVRHAPPGSRIWSLGIASYCMAPACMIESVVSFKMSSRLNEIMNGSPSQTKQILHEEGLDYFLFDATSGITDLLPFSSLFDPRNIGRYLGIKWTDGSTYLLTWRGPRVMLFDRATLKKYELALAGADNPWFRFRELPSQMNATIDRLKKTRHPWRSLDFAWRSQIVHQ